MLVILLGSFIGVSAPVAAAQPLPQQSHQSSSSAAASRVTGTTPSLTTAPGAAQDARLQARMTVRARRLSIDALMETVSQTTKVPLTLDRFYSGHNLQLYVRNRPAADLMKSVATLLKGEWAASEDGGYTLRPTTATVSYQHVWWNTLNRERDRAKGEVIQSFVGLMGGDSSIPYDPSTQRDAAKNNTVEEGDGIRSDVFWHNLPFSTKQAIAQSFNDGYTYCRFPIHLPYSFEGGVFVPFSRLPDSCSSILMLSFQSLNRTLPPIPVRAVFINNARGNLFADVLLADGVRGAAGLSLYNPVLSSLPIFSVDHRFVTAPDPKSGIKISREWKRMFAYQHKAVWDNGVPSGSVPDVLPPRLPDIVEWLNAKTGREFIADYYSLPARLMTAAERSQTPAPDCKKELDQIAGVYDISWKDTEPGLTLLAHNRWYRENQLDAPQNAVDRLVLDRDKARQRAPKLDKDTAEVYLHLEMASLITARFSRWQIANGLYFYVDEDKLPSPDKQDAATVLASNCQPFADISATCLSYPATCRFFGRLSPENRAALLTDGLLISKLNSAERDAASQIDPEAAAAVYADNSGKARLKIASSMDGRVWIPSLQRLFGNRNEGEFPYRLRFSVTSK